VNPWLHGVVYGTGMVTLLLTAAALATWWERKFSAQLHNRVGPIIVGWWGILQPIADAVKAVQKDDIVPRDADKPLFNLAPVFPVALVLATAAVIHLGGWWDETGTWQSTLLIADLDIGILWVLAIAGLMVFPLWMAGWSSNNKYALLAGMRAVAQGISYEIPLVLAALVPVVVTGSFSLSGIVAWQAEHGWLVWRLPLVGLVAFVLFFASSLAESNRIPFDIPEAESELISGVYVEYTGLKMTMFVLAEYIHTFIASALAATLFLGGPHGPAPALLGPLWMALKTLTLFLIIYWIRWTWFRFRADQLMELCWKWLVPLGLVLVMLTALMVLVGWA